MSTFSIVLPLYNKERHIRDALNSILTQTVQDFEIIVIDDGSTDKSAEQAEAIVDHRIRLIKQENKGVSIARNRGIMEAKNEFIAFLDADDQYHPDFLERIKSLMVDFPNLSGYATNLELVFAHQPSEPFARIPDKKPFQMSLQRFLKIGLDRGPIVPSSAVVKKETLLAIGAFPEHVKMGEDLDTWIRLLDVSPIGYDPKPSVKYFQTADNRACENNAIPKSHCFFSTLDKIANKMQSSAELKCLCREYKNRFLIRYCIQQIMAGEKKEGRDLLIKCNTKVYSRIKWKWIGLSIVYGPLFYRYLVLKEIVQRRLMW